MMYVATYYIILHVGPLFPYQNMQATLHFFHVYNEESSSKLTDRLCEFTKHSPSCPDHTKLSVQF